MRSARRVKKILIFFLLLLLSCATIPKKEHVVNASKKYDICILYHKSKIRNSIVDGLLEKFNASGLNIIVDDAFNIKDHPPDNYRAVIIFSGIHAFIPDAYPRNYIWKYRDKENIIHVFMTFFTKKGVSIRYKKRNKIDTVAAASVKENSDNIVEIIYDLTLLKLKSLAE